MTIFLTKKAERNYRDIKSFISYKWGDRVAEEFEKKLEDFLDILEDFPELGNLAVAEKGIFGFQLTKQTRIFYRIKKNRIIVLALFDVRQDPNKSPK